MRKISAGVRVLLAGCFTPAYRASEVPVPSAYGVDANTSDHRESVADSVGARMSSTPAVYVSPTLAPAPFWTSSATPRSRCWCAKASARTRMFASPSRVSRVRARRVGSRRSISCRR